VYWLTLHTFCISLFHEIASWKQWYNSTKQSSKIKLLITDCARGNHINPPSPPVINSRSQFTWLIRTESSLLHIQPTQHRRQLGCLTTQARCLSPPRPATQASTTSTVILTALLFRSTYVGPASECQVLGFAVDELIWTKHNSSQPLESGFRIWSGQCIACPVY
jgi:hypothetical protein